MQISRRSKNDFFDAVTDSRIVSCIDQLPGNSSHLTAVPERSGNRVVSRDGNRLRESADSRAQKRLKDCRGIPVAPVEDIECTDVAVRPRGRPVLYDHLQIARRERRLV
jgi:hypothetical protein